MDPARALQVLIVGGDAAFRALMSDRVARSGLRVCSHTPDPADASRIVAHEHPDVCLVADVAPFDGVAAARTVLATAPNLHVVLVGPDPSDLRLLAAVDAGASGYLCSDADSHRLGPVLLDAAAGRSAFPRQLEALLIARLGAERG